MEKFHATCTYHLPLPCHLGWGHSHLAFHLRISSHFFLGEPSSHTSFIYALHAAYGQPFSANTCTNIHKSLNKSWNDGCDLPPSLAQTKDARGIYASSSNASPSVTFSCNLLVHSSSLSMERCSIDVPGSQRKVSMHGRVIGPILMLEMQGTCCARTGSWAINPKGSSLSRLTFSGSYFFGWHMWELPWQSLHESVVPFTLSKFTSSLKTCEKYGLSRHPFTLVWCCLPEMSISW